MSSSATLVLLFFLFSHPILSQRPAGDRVNAIWKKLHSTSPIKANPTGQPMSDQSYGDVLNTHTQTRPRTADRMRDLIQVRHQENVMYAPPERGCDFEKECEWTWKNEMMGGFRINSPGNQTGPTEDADGNKNGKFFLASVVVRYFNFI